MVATDQWKRSETFKKRKGLVLSTELLSWIGRHREIEDANVHSSERIRGLWVACGLYIECWSHVIGWNMARWKTRMLYDVVFVVNTLYLRDIQQILLKCTDCLFTWYGYSYTRPRALYLLGPVRHYYGLDIAQGNFQFHTRLAYTHGKPLLLWLITLLSRY